MTMTVNRRALLGFSAAALLPGRLAAQPLTEQQALIDQSLLTVRAMLVDPDLPDITPFIRACRGIFIVPELFRGGFFIGGQGGTGVVLLRRPGGQWGYPAFMDLAAGSIGLQFGAQVSSMILTIMTESGVGSFLDSRVTLGANASVALISQGLGLDARTGLALNADMYAFSRSEGLFVGGAIEGSYISENGSWNVAYYGPGATAEGIFAGSHSALGADALRATLL